ncbi:MAG: XRE family transcriptional regulator [Muribaculaceae bacterium]|nr:XRE family transcriptional regulator [Muribaculaceae bacterium]
MPVHIGKEIKAELRRQERGVSWLAYKLHCDRTNVYDIFKREGIDTRLLERISIILNRNFFSLYCREDSIDVEDNSTDVS